MGPPAFRIALGDALAASRDAFLDFLLGTGCCEAVGEWRTFALEFFPQPLGGVPHLEVGPEQGSNLGHWHAGPNLREPVHGCTPENSGD
ncbi:hypothetical protein [Arenimonas composti]|uniref:hypothetical protein n=1 Tax=Arenimonas composti TaxID=370776 RepID=UPI00146D331F|nr:hypothetical protein [Arenimonas composti]